MTRITFTDEEIETLQSALSYVTGRLDAAIDRTSDPTFIFAMMLSRQKIRRVAEKISKAVTPRKAP